jgi:hypothetical protein
MILKGQDLIDGHLDEQAPATAGTQTDRGR